MTGKCKGTKGGEGPSRSLSSSGGGTTEDRGRSSARDSQILVVPSVSKVLLEGSEKPVGFELVAVGVDVTFLKVESTEVVSITTVEE